MKSRKALGLFVGAVGFKSFMVIVLAKVVKESEDRLEIGSWERE